MGDWSLIGVRFALYLTLAALFGLAAFSLYGLRTGERGDALALRPWLVASAVLGLAPWQHAGEAALGIILSLSVGQYAAGLLLSARPRPAIAAAVFAPILALALYRIAGLWLAPALGHDAEAADVSISLAILPVLTVIALWLYQATLPLWRSTPAGRAWQTHATYGFYCGVLADRIVSAIHHRLPQGTAHAH